MASLEDFSDSKPLDIADFQIEGPIIPVNNKQSNVNLAAYTASLSENPESVEANYLQASDQMDQGNTQAVDAVRDRARTMTRESSQAALTQILTDPGVSDEQKQASVNAYADDFSELFGVRDVVSTEALIADSEDETEESSMARIRLSDSITRVNEAARQQQIALNRALSEQDPSMVEIGAGFLELMAPYVEQGITGKMLSDIRDGDTSSYLEAFSLLGSTKDEMRDTIKRIPPEERGPIIQKVVDAVNTNSTLVFSNENDFVRMDMLRSVLEEGYYDDTDMWVDNIVSMAELVGLPVVGFARARRLKSARRFAKATDAAPSSALSDDALRAAEDAAETRATERATARREEAQETGGNAVVSDSDPVRRAEDQAERVSEANRAVRTDDDSLRTMEDEAARRAYVRSEVKPVSLAENYRNTNPGKARASASATAAAKTDQVSEALYGTNQTEAMAYTHGPEMATDAGGVSNKVSHPDFVRDQPLPPKPRVMDTASSNGAIYLTDAEKVSTATRVVNDFNNTMGLTTRTEMTVPQVSEIGNQLRIGVTYGPKDNGWASGADALERVKTSLRHYGVKDSDLTLMERRGGEYVPAKGPLTEEGDYLVKVDYPYSLSANEVEDWSDLDVMYNFFDRIPHIMGAPSGSLQRHIIDAHSMLHENITFGANVAVDKAAQLEKDLIELTKSFSEKYNALGKASQQAVEMEIKRANKEGKNATTTKLTADGYGEEEIAALQSWRDVWDTMYWVENRDMVGTLRNLGYGVMEDAANDTRLFAKDLHRSRVGGTQRAYDSETGEMVQLTKEEVTDLYDKNGTLAQLRSAMQVGDEKASLVISRNNPGGPYLRRLRDDDQVLNYREGYYTVYYEHPKFIDRIVKDSRGNIIEKGAVATARDTKTAERHRKTFQLEADENVEYVVRDNRERMRFDSDDNWDLQDAAGRTAQRVRGERLEDATSPITDEMHNHILGPVDSLIRSARSISSRVPMRDYLEATKARAINQYGHMFPKDAYGRPQFPSSSKGIHANQGYSKEAADARTTVEYISSLERGYVNAVDDGLKAMFRVMADMSGKKGLSHFERAANYAAEMGGPTRLARGTAFTLYLALNPVRQFIVQSHQAVQLVAIAPKYATTRLAGDMGSMLAMKMGTMTAEQAAKVWKGRTASELKEMMRAFDQTGLFASVDKQNMVRGTLSDMADAQAAGGLRGSKAQRALGLGAKGIGFFRKAGFDAGEEVNMLSSWLTHYDMEKTRLGKEKLSQSEMDRVTALARSYTYNMNRAGDMPYNENALGMVFQFMQVPHKAFLQMTTNRNLTKAQKARLATFNLVMYGGPPGALLTAYAAPWLPETGETREAILQGLEGYTFNKLASLTYGEDVGIDFSSLSATDQTGLLEFVGSLWTTDAGKILAESPAGSLVAGSNPRITNFARTAAQYFHAVDTNDGNDVTRQQVVESFLGMASGYSSFMKARVALREGQKVSSSGGITDSSVSTPEAVAAMAGFSTLDEARGYWASNEMYEGRKSFDDDVKEHYRLMKQELAREGITNEEREFITRALNVGLQEFKDSPRALRIFQQQIQYDIENGDLSLFESAIKGHEYMDPAHTRNLINTAPLTDEQREQANRQLDFIDNYSEE